ncbi:MAG: beta-lactamase family protein [Rhodoferax sp.]|nr:beta-lactamase family protein [Rhodoferax sp.]
MADAWHPDPGVLWLRSAPGMQFSYANLSHTLAAMVLEAAVNERYEVWMARELLQPLAMADSMMATGTASSARRGGARRGQGSHPAPGGIASRWLARVAQEHGALVVQPAYQQLGAAVERAQDVLGRHRRKGNEGLFDGATARQARGVHGSHTGEIVFRDAEE